MMNVEGWLFQAVERFCDWLTDRQMNEWTNKQTDICECRVAFATEKGDTDRTWEFPKPSTEFWHCGTTIYNAVFLPFETQKLDIGCPKKESTVAAGY